jgi:uncharacterized protein (DUF433 family)
MRIKAWELKLIWEDGTDNEVARFLPEGTAREIEEFIDYWEQKYGEDEEEEE